MAQEPEQDSGKILVVDDDDDIRGMLVARLEHHGFETVTAPSLWDVPEMIVVYVMLLLLVPDNQPHQLGEVI